MRIAVVFDTPHVDWTPDRHAAEMVAEIANQRNVEPEMEYQVAQALQKNGHDVLMLGVHDDLRDMSARLADWKPALVFNATEAFLANSELDYLIPALLESEGYRYTGAPPLALLVTRNKAMSKKILAYHGVNVPAFRSYRVGERPGSDIALRFPLIVKPLQADASEGIAQASIVHDLGALDRPRRVRPRALRAARDRGGVHRGTRALRDDHRQRRWRADPADRRDGVRRGGLAPRRSHRDPEREVGSWHIASAAGSGTCSRGRSRRSPESASPQICFASYRALWLRDYARVDVRLAPDGQLWFIEANANPFLSYGHDSAEAAHKAGLTYNVFIQRIVDEAMARDA